MSESQDTHPPPAVGELLPRAAEAFGVRRKLETGVNCAVDIQVRGIGAKAGRVATVRTVWAFDQPGATPRLVTAIPKP